MVVFVLERVPVGVRGKLSRWMLEIQAGLFVGHLSARIRDKLWDDVVKKRRATGACLVLYSANNEQGFLIRSAGELTRKVIDFDGLLLIQRKSSR
jgi:CRISPR-associated protein Cas2